MSKEIIVNADARETRIAVREDGQLVELHIEREERVVGSIYKGRVDNVPHSLDAAFVEIGLDRNAFLYAGDIIAGGGDDADGDAEPGGFDRRGRRTRPQQTIRELVKRGQEVLVQVVKGPRGTKGSRVSTRISLPGRYLVFMPDENSTGVSRKIDDPKERDRLKRIVEGIRKPGYGLIVRTEAEDKTERELRQDLDFLETTWADIKKKVATSPAPSLIYQDLTLLFRILRDAFGQDVDKLILDSARDYKRAHELLDFFGPGLKDRVELYDGEKPVFEQLGIESEITKLLGRRVWLKSGGYLVIDQAEALVAIDVNSGKFTGQTTGLADTIVQTNLEAVAEIGRQLRLRDLGGILVLDLIDMNSAAERKKVEVALEVALKGDKSRCKISHISPLGLVEMTRKRTGETVNEQMNDMCPYCAGSGRIPSAESVSIDVARDLRRLARSAGQIAEGYVVTCHPLVASHLVGADGEEIEFLEHELERAVYVRASEDLHQEKYDIQPGRLDELDRRFGATQRKNQVVDVQIIRDPLNQTPDALGLTEAGYLVDLPGGAKYAGQSVRARLVRVGRSLAEAELLVRGGNNGNGGGDDPVTPFTPPAPRRAGNPSEPVSEGRGAAAPPAAPGGSKRGNLNRRRGNANAPREGAGV